MEKIIRNRSKQRRRFRVGDLDIQPEHSSEAEVGLLRAGTTIIHRVVSNQKTLLKRGRCDVVYLEVLIMLLNSSQRVVFAQDVLSSGGLPMLQDIIKLDFSQKASISLALKILVGLIRSDSDTKDEIYSMGFFHMAAELCEKAGKLGPLQLAAISFLSELALARHPFFVTNIIEDPNQSPHHGIATALLRLLYNSGKFVRRVAILLGVSIWQSDMAIKNLLQLDDSHSSENRSCINQSEQPKYSTRIMWVDELVPQLSRLLMDGGGSTQTQYETAEFVALLCISLSNLRVARRLISVIATLATLKCGINYSSFGADPRADVWYERNKEISERSDVQTTPQKNSRSIYALQNKSSHDKISALLLPSHDSESEEEDDDDFEESGEQNVVPETVSYLPSPTFLQSKGQVAADPVVVSCFVIQRIVTLAVRKVESLMVLRGRYRSSAKRAMAATTGMLGLIHATSVATTKSAKMTHTLDKTPIKTHAFAVSDTGSMINDHNDASFGNESRGNDNFAPTEKHGELLPPLSHHLSERRMTTEIQGTEAGKEGKRNKIQKSGTMSASQDPQEEHDKARPSSAIGVPHMTQQPQQLHHKNMAQHGYHYNKDNDTADKSLNLVTSNERVTVESLLSALREEGVHWALLIVAVTYAKPLKASSASALSGKLAGVKEYEETSGGQQEASFLAKNRKFRSNASINVSRNTAVTTDHHGDDNGGRCLEDGYTSCGVTSVGHGYLYVQRDCPSGADPSHDIVHTAAAGKSDESILSISLSEMITSTKLSSASGADTLDQQCERREEGTKLSAGEEHSSTVNVEIAVVSTSTDSAAIMSVGTTIGEELQLNGTAKNASHFDGRKITMESSNAEKDEVVVRKSGGLHNDFAVIDVIKVIKEGEEEKLAAATSTADASDDGCDMIVFNIGNQKQHILADSSKAGGNLNLVTCPNKASFDKRESKEKITPTESESKEANNALIKDRQLISPNCGDVLAARENVDNRPKSSGGLAVATSSPLILPVGAENCTHKVIVGLSIPSPDPIHDSFSNSALNAATISSDFPVDTAATETTKVRKGHVRFATKKMEIDNNAVPHPYTTNAVRHQPLLTSQPSMNPASPPCSEESSDEMSRVLETVMQTLQAWLDVDLEVTWDIRVALLQCGVNMVDCNLTDGRVKGMDQLSAAGEDAHCGLGVSVTLNAVGGHSYHSKSPAYRSDPKCNTKSIKRPSVEKSELHVSDPSVDNYEEDVISWRSDIKATLSQLFSDEGDGCFGAGHHNHAREQFLQLLMRKFQLPGRVSVLRSLVDEALRREQKNKNTAPTPSSSSAAIQRGLPKANLASTAESAAEVLLSGVAFGSSSGAPSAHDTNLSPQKRCTSSTSAAEIVEGFQSHTTRLQLQRSSPQRLLHHHVHSPYIDSKSFSKVAHPQWSKASANNASVELVGAAPTIGLFTNPTEKKDELGEGWDYKAVMDLLLKLGEQGGLKKEDEDDLHNLVRKMGQRLRSKARSSQPPSQMASRRPSVDHSETKNSRCNNGDDQEPSSGVSYQLSKLIRPTTMKLSRTADKEFSTIMGTILRPESMISSSNKKSTAAPAVSTSLSPRAQKQLPNCHPNERNKQVSPAVRRKHEEYQLRSEAQFPQKRDIFMSSPIHAPLRTIPSTRQKLTHRSLVIPRDPLSPATSPYPPMLGTPHMRDASTLHHHRSGTLPSDDPLSPELANDSTVPTTHSYKCSSAISIEGEEEQETPRVLQTIAQLDVDNIFR